MFFLRSLWIIISTSRLKVLGGRESYRGTESRYVAKIIAGRGGGKINKILSFMGQL